MPSSLSELRVLVTGASAGFGEVIAQRFAAEVYVHGALRHPNIVRMLDHGASPERYLAMEHVEGCSVLSLAPPAMSTSIIPPSTLGPVSTVERPRTRVSWRAPVSGMSEGSVR